LKREALASLASNCCNSAHYVCGSFARVAKVAFSGNIFTSSNNALAFDLPKKADTAKALFFSLCAPRLPKLFYRFEF
jgi:hypothetical protein